MDSNVQNLCYTYCGCKLWQEIKERRGGMPHILNTALVLYAINESLQKNKGSLRLVLGFKNKIMWLTLFLQPKEAQLNYISL